MSDPSNLVPHVAFCEVHGKKGFTKKNAKKVIRMLRNRKETGMREYRCGSIPNLWHVGHLPPSIMWGFRSADEVYGSSDAA